MDVILISGLVVGLTEVLKRATGLHPRFVPLGAIIVALFLGLGSFWVNGTPVDWDTVMKCIAVGLSSVGLYSGVKNTIG